MSKINSILAAVGIVAAGALNASASLDGPFTTTTPVSTSTLTDWADPLTFAQFNPSLGTLEAVILTFSSSGMTDLTVSNAVGSGGATHVMASTSVQISVEDGGMHFLANDPQITLVSSTYNFGTISDGVVVSSGELPLSGSYSNLYTASAILSEFTGHGTETLNGSTYSYTTISYGGGNTTSGQVTMAGLTGTVTYEYNPVPEPTTMVAGALMLLPFCGGALRKLRRKTQA
jgi:hypothetical protein